MSPLEAQRIIDTLAGGVDPETGELLPPGTPLAQADVIRALFAASKALGTARRAPSAAKAGKSWEPDEDEQLLQAFDGGASVPDLAKLHERSRGAIRSRLMGHGRIQLNQAQSS